MIKLQLTNERGQSQHDTNLTPEQVGQVKFMELKKRHEGVGGGFKGRAPNRCTIWLSTTVFKNVVLHDNYSFESISEMQLVDSTGQIPVLTFVKSDMNPREWVAQQPHMVIGGNTQTTVPGYQSAPVRAFEVRKKLIEEMGDLIGEVGVNDLKHLLLVEVQVPVNNDNGDLRNQVFDLADKLAEEMGTRINVSFQPIGATTVMKPVVGEGHLGEHPQQDRAMAGRQQVAAVGYPTGTGPTDAMALQPVGSGTPGETPLKPGQNEQTYGSKGPQDQ